MEIGIIIAAVSGLIAAALFALYFIASRNDDYLRMTAPLSQKEYTFKFMIPAGLFLMKIIRYRHTKRDIKTREEFRELYGEEYMPYYLQIHIANKFGMGIMALFLACVFTLLYDVSLMTQRSDDLMRLADRPVFSEENNTIKRPDTSGTGSARSHLPLEAVIGLGDNQVVSNYNFMVPEQLPADAECVRKAADEFNKKYIDRYRTGLEQGISRSLNLSSYKILGTRIQLITEPGGYLTANGELLTRPLAAEGLIALKAYAVFSKGEESQESQHFVISIIPIPAMETAVQEINNMVEAINKGKNNEALTETGIDLPTEIGGIPIIWRIPDFIFTNDSYQVLLLGILLFLIIFFFLDSNVSKQVTQKREKIRLAFPDFINKFVLLLGSGMTTNRALNRIMEDYDKLLSEKRVERMPLYEELRMMLNEVKTGKHDMYALEDFALRCKIPEVMKFVSAVTQNMKSGSMEMVMILKTQSKEVWEARKNYARVKGEQAGTKLIFSMMMMVLAVLVVVLYPAMSGMGF